jgi:hypothetical protein
VVGDCAGNRRLAKLKKKSVIGLLAVALLVVVPLITACGVTTTEILDAKWETPHIVTGGFANCFICHTGGASPISLTHLDYVIDDDNTCFRAGCHPVMEGLEAPETVQ